eukprot:gene11374-biopygen5621
MHPLQSFALTSSRLIAPRLRPSANSSRLHISFRFKGSLLGLREYFCGVKTVLKPARCVVPFDKVQIYRIGTTSTSWQHEYLPAYLAPQAVPRIAQ